MKKLKDIKYMDNLQEEAKKFGVSLQETVSKELDVWGSAQTIIDEINYFCHIHNVKSDDVSVEKECAEYG